MTTSLTHPLPATDTRTVHSASGRRTRAAGALYVAAWLLGLTLQPSGVTSAEQPTGIVAHYVDHRVTSMMQILLVHVVAAFAVLVIARALSRSAREFRRTRTGRWASAAGLAICALSITQAVLGLAMVATAGTVDPRSTRQLLTGIERLDAAKLLALAALCTMGVLLSRDRIVPRWTGRLAAATAASLILASVALSGAVPALVRTAAPALALLLTWVGAVSVAVSRSGS